MARGILAAVFFFIIFSLGIEARAGERLIKLKDGSVIQGEVLSKEGDVYRIKTKVLGVVGISEADILSISIAGSEMAPIPLTDQEKNYQQKILTNPQTMEDIKTLAQDKSVMALLSDPQLRDAMARHDLESIQTNEKFIKFMSNPAVRNIIGNATSSGEK